MSISWVSLFFSLLLCRVSCLGNETENDKVVEGSASDIVRKVIAKGCAKKYTVTCFKMDMVDLVDIMSAKKSFQLFPGVSVVKDNATDEGLKKLPDSLIRSLASEFPYGEDGHLDEYLIERVSDYLSTHSVSLRLLDPVTVAQSIKQREFEGRGKNKGQSTLIAGAMMMKGTLMAIGFGAIAALAGKALMAGLLSLMLSAILALKSSSRHGDGGAHKQTTYEIISKPIYSHSHTHSAEIQHEHDHSHTHAGSYSYGRNLNYNSNHGSTAAAEVEYIQIPTGKEDEDMRGKRSQNHEYTLEYKTISNEDLKNYYNNLDYAGTQNQETIHRKQKSFPEELKNKQETDVQYLPSLTTVNPIGATQPTHRD